MVQKLIRSVLGTPSPIVHIAFQDGRFQVEGIGHWKAYLRDPYHLFLTIPWSLFLGVIVLIYGAINTLFRIPLPLRPGRFHCECESQFLFGHVLFQCPNVSLHWIWGHAPHIHLHQCHCHH